MAKKNKNETIKAINENIGIVRVFILIAITVLLMSFTFEQLSIVDENISYMSFNANDLSVYDPYITDKHYYSPADNNGIKVNFSNLISNDFIECIIGGGYNVGFYNGVELVGETVITDNTRHVIEVPTSAISSGYDCIVFTPTSGKILYISYIAPILSYDSNVVIEDVGYRTFTMSTVYSKEGHSGLVDGLYTHIISANNEEIVIDVISTNNELNSTLISIVDSEGKTIAKFPEYAILYKYVSGVGDEPTTYNLKVLSKNYSISNLYLKYQLDYSSEPDLWPINPYVQVNNDVYNSTLLRETDNMSEFSNISVNAENIVTFTDDNITIDKSLFIPKGYSLQLSEGQNINLINNAFILCYDYVEFNGSSAKPITFTSSDNSLYSGLVVMQGSRVSTLDYVYFDNLGEVQSGIWKLTGAVTFFEADVVIKNCKFLNNRSEDGLNSVRCYIEVYDTLFENTFQDAYDADFCTGLFENVTFINSGNDAFDISTSTFTLKDCKFYETHDKAISTGENSTITAKGITIDTAQTGLSAKDLSLLTVDDVNITNVFVGICVYQKKPEFGASEVYATNYNLQEPYDFEYIIEKQDTVIVNGKQLIASNNKKQEIIIQRMIEEIEI